MNLVKVMCKTIDNLYTSGVGQGYVQCLTIGNHFYITHLQKKEISEAYLL